MLVAALLLDGRHLRYRFTLFSCVGMDNLNQWIDDRQSFERARHQQKKKVSYLLVTSIGRMSVVQEHGTAFWKFYMSMMFFLLWVPFDILGDYLHLIDVWYPMIGSALLDGIPLCVLLNLAGLKDISY